MNAAHAQPQQGGILPAAAAALPFGSQVEITCRDGRTVQGIIKDTQGAKWVDCSDGATILLSTPWGPVDLSMIAAVRVTKDARDIAAERAARKYGEEVFTRRPPRATATRKRCTPSRSIFLTSPNSRAR